MEKQHLPFSQIIDYVREFHDAFKVGYAREPEGRLSEAEYRLRHRLMHEENEEYLEAASEGDLVGVADALGDQLYILCGTILKHGLQHKIVEVFEEIQRSNMSKLDANGEPIFREDGKVMKSELYFRPNIAKVINASEVEL
jgi:predicted HAD superfamily Cof-like phosphohydrolase